MSQHFTTPTLKPVLSGNADVEQKKMLDAAHAALGFIPNMYANMVNVPGVLSTYLHGYAEFRQRSGFTPVEQEVIFLAISQHNGCHYCTAAHSMLADKVSGVPGPVLAAIRSNQPLPDPKLQALYAFTQELVSTSGKPSQELGEAFLAAGYSDILALQIVLAAAVKTLSNYTNHLCKTELDDKFAGYKI
ncbi:MULTISPECIES: carboxymuconolactone decarboxylase family protein [Aeromonas]|uniref:carboxymuconolactone decarboxylase family protein n=1 Tax=Aeromonas TaxID=642 RepID=UPI00084B056D|nr:MULTISPECIES: carboxymuconolactone decarboxylase family protein [Aeromonas]MDX7689402.1 carboxymuconolactone decarboxylase family protein [Aeromonas caviae]OEC48796.1 alkylhydroperoxidase [Aeromonas sp. ANNP30]OEC61342.1 alkylhydroperoxidase [Aeromonas sp. ANP5]